MANTTTPAPRDGYVNSLGAQAGGGTAAGTTADILRNQILSQLITVIDAITVTFGGTPPPGNSAGEAD